MEQRRLKKRQAVGDVIRRSVVREKKSAWCGKAGVVIGRDVELEEMEYAQRRQEERRSPEWGAVSDGVERQGDAEAED